MLFTSDREVAMSPRSTRDPARTGSDMARWLAGRLGVPTVDVYDVTVPKAGYSNDTILFNARWGDRSEELVARIQPTAHQLFVTPDVLTEAAVLTALRDADGTPVPHVLFTESDPSLLGAPFVVMERMHGRVPGDVPSWQAAGWTTELAPEDVGRMQDNALGALAALHRISWEDGFAFLDRGRAGRAWPAYVDELERWWEWSAPSRIFDADEFAAAYETLRARCPTDVSGEGVVWGDARIGNMMFADDLSVVAMFDWETATLGPAEIDLGWWLMFDDFLGGAQGVTRLPGSMSRDTTIARWTELVQRPARDLDWFEALACVVMAMVNSRLGVLLMRDRGLDDDIAGQYARRSIRMATERLAR